MDRLLQRTDLIGQDTAGFGFRGDRVEIGIILDPDGPVPEK